MPPARLSSDNVESGAVPTGTPSPIQFTRCEAALGGIAGAAYVATTFFREYLLVYCFGLDPTPMQEEFQARAATYVGAQLGLRVPALLVILAIGLRERGTFREGTVHRSAGRFAQVIVITILVSLTLNLVSLWPWSWRWASNPTRLLFAGVSSIQMPATALVYALSSIIVVPVIEEYVFRRWLLISILRLLRSPWLSITLTSFLFAFGHLGYWPPTEASTGDLVNAGWLFLASLYLGARMIQGESLYIAIAVHSTRNLLELVTLMHARPGI